MLDVQRKGEVMALKNPNLKKLSGPVSGSGQAAVTLVQPAVALPDPGGNDGTPTWPARYAAYIQSVQITPKYSQDWE